MQKLIRIYTNNPAERMDKILEINTLLERGYKVVYATAVGKNELYYILELISKPVTTTNEQPVTTCLKRSEYDRIKSALDFYGGASPLEDNNLLEKLHRLIV